MAFTHVASQQRLLLDLYEEAIQGLHRAESAYADMSARAVSLFHSQLVNCQQVMHQLTASLDIRSGGEPAAQLMRLYDRINFQLVRANIMQSADGLGEACDLLVQLRQRLLRELEPEEVAESRAEPLPLIPSAPAFLPRASSE